MLLSGWKQIAMHLNCSTRTAQRWQSSGLPVYRPRGHECRGTVTAFSDELDGWLRRMEGEEPAMRPSDSASVRSSSFFAVYDNRRWQAATESSIQALRASRQQSRLLRAQMLTDMNSLRATIAGSLLPRLDELVPGSRGQRPSPGRKVI